MKTYENPKTEEMQSITPVDATEDKKDPTQLNLIPLNNNVDRWCILSVTSFICGIITGILGFYKMLFYSSGDYYPFKTINAYVGGDAYNLIINGTYATAYFVLTAMFFLCAILLVIVHYISNQPTIDNQGNKKTQEDVSSEESSNM